MSGIKIMNYKAYNKNTLRGFFDLTIEKWGLEIYGCTYHCKDNGSEWISFPSKEFTNDAGEKKFKSLVRFTDRDTQDNFGKMVIDAIKKQESGAGSSSSGSNDDDDVPF